MDKVFAEHFAADWIASWNAHDLERVLSHYADEFEMSSPMIVQVAGEPSGMLRGKTAVGAYWKIALGLIPDLQFELLEVLAGVNSITLYYKGARVAFPLRSFTSARTTRLFGLLHTMPSNRLRSNAVALLTIEAQPIISPDLREKPSRSMNSEVRP